MFILLWMILVFPGNNGRGRMVLNQTFTIGNICTHLVSQTTNNQIIYAINPHQIILPLHFHSLAELGFPFALIDHSLVSSYVISCFAEPMLTMGSINPILWDDNWTVVTADGSLSAQFEHTILITKDGAEILTLCWQHILIAGNSCNQTTRATLFVFIWNVTFII